MHNPLKLTGGGKPAPCERPKVREAAPEVYRVALMFGICLLHSITMCGHVTVWAANILASCVNGFVFISGWYGVRFRPSKVIRLYALSIACGAVLLSLNLWLGRYAFATDKASFKALHGMFFGQWFLNAYAFMMCLTPLVDLAISRMPARYLASVLLPLGCLAFGWSFATGLPVVGRLLPGTSGLGSYTPLALLATYTVARLCRHFDVARFVTWRRLAAAIALMWVCTGIGMGEYASPFAVTLAAAWFFVYRRVAWPAWLGAAARLLGPSMFSVLLLHCSGLGFAAMTALETRWADTQGWPLGAVYLAVAALTFVVCLALDVPRRLVVWGTRRWWEPALGWVDALWLRLAPEEPKAR